MKNLFDLHGFYKHITALYGLKMYKNEINIIKYSPGVERVFVSHFKATTFPFQGEIFSCKFTYSCGVHSVYHDLHPAFKGSL